MKLVISIINRDDRDGLTKALTDAGYQATVIGTTGGFLRRGNATLLSGVQDEHVERVLEIIQRNCHMRMAYMTPYMGMGTEELLMVEPIEVQVGGAVVFIQNVERFLTY